jgi:hypothetical protein
MAEADSQEWLSHMSLYDPEKKQKRSHHALCFLIGVHSAKRYILPKFATLKNH